MVALLHDAAGSAQGRLGWRISCWGHEVAVRLPPPPLPGVEAAELKTSLALVVLYGLESVFAITS